MVILTHVKFSWWFAHCFHGLTPSAHVLWVVFFVWSFGILAAVGFPGLPPAASPRQNRTPASWKPRVSSVVGFCCFFTGRWDVIHLFHPQRKLESHQMQPTPLISGGSPRTDEKGKDTRRRASFSRHLFLVGFHHSSLHFAHGVCGKFGQGSRVGP